MPTPASLSTLLTAYVTTSVLLTLSPGPDALLVMRSSLRGGRLLGLGVVGGIMTSWAVWGTAAMLGLGALMAWAPRAFTLLKALGALYLGWLGLRMLWGCFIARTTTAEGALLQGSSTAPPQNRASFQRFAGGWRTGVLANLTNPFVGLVTITLFPQFMPPGVNVRACTALLTALQMMVAAMVFGSLVVVTAPLAKLLARPLYTRLIDGLCAVALIGFALALALSHLKV
ncbi:LysE family translocator [Formicincola oecophyllae]|uniref:LysE family translocator n=1 Tax=Formicincola oecophyllae TaxID=2558361 RepID=UPI00143D97AD|nr:LysE family translocator [Formicincola oecophyllae]